MTTIIGIQYSDGCVIASDAQTTVAERPYRGAGMVKQIQRGGWLVAAGGDAAPCDLIMYRWEPPEPDGGVDIHAFVVTEVVPSLRDTIEVAENKTDAEYTVLLAHSGEVFQIHTDGTVLHHHDGLYGLGSGAAYAIGAITAGVSVLDAMEIAAENDVFTGGPFTINEQKKPTTGDE